MTQATPFCAAPADADLLAAAAPEACDVLVIGGGPAGSTVTDDGTTRRWRARYVVDSSGRDTLLAGPFGIKRGRRECVRDAGALSGESIAVEAR